MKRRANQTPRKPNAAQTKRRANQTPRKPNVAQTKRRAKKTRGRKRKPSRTDLIQKARQVMNTTRKLVQKRCELEDRLRSWCPEDLLEFWKRD